MSTPSVTFCVGRMVDVRQTPRGEVKVGSTSYAKGKIRAAEREKKSGVNASTVDRPRVPVPELGPPNSNSVMVHGHAKDSSNPIQIQSDMQAEAVGDSRS